MKQETYIFITINLVFFENPCLKSKEELKNKVNEILKNKDLDKRYFI